MVKTFRNNEGLRGSLFNGIDDESEAKDEFQDIVENLSSSVYDFIEIK